MLNLPKIPDFYKNREIFITGGTGFVGKALVEKLLRSCPDLKKIFLLIRKKKNQGVQERFESLKSLKVFSILLEKYPNAFEKVVPIEGDTTELGLGISQYDLLRLQNVSIIFNSSASVRFDDPLKDAILVNVRSTQELLNIALGLKKLDAFIHISTAYCNSDYSMIEEKIYPARADWKKLIEMAETLEGETFDVLSPKIMNNMANTYIFTKSLAENVCEEYSDRVPITICRPSIISAAQVEPIPGWYDQIGGFPSLILANSTGIIRIFMCDDNANLNGVPVDRCVRGIILAAYKKVLIDEKHQVTVYNLVNGSRSCKAAYEDTADLRCIAPPSMLLWAPNQSRTKCLYWFRINSVLFHFFPGLLIDFILKNFTQVKISLLKVQRIIASVQMALLYFVMNAWEFKTDNFMDLDKFIRSEELEDFSVYMVDNYKNFVDYSVNTMLYGRRNMLNDPDETIPGAKRKLALIKMVDSIFKGIFWSLVLYYGYSFLKYKVL